MITPISFNNSDAASQPGAQERAVVSLEEQADVNSMAMTPEMRDFNLKMFRADVLQKMNDAKDDEDKQPEW